MERLFIYNNTRITFRKENEMLMVNATEMAKIFEKSPKDWLHTQQANDIINSLSAVRHICPTGLVLVNQDGSYQGTWMHEDVAIEFARWLSPVFAIWCNDRIKELLITGRATASNDDETILRAIKVFSKRVDESTRKMKAVEEENEMLQNINRALAPKAAYFDNMLLSKSTYTMTQVAKELGLSAISLEKILNKKKIMFKQCGQWMLYAQYQNKGYTRSRTHLYALADGRKRSSVMTVFTELGRMFILNLINNDQ